MNSFDDKVLCKEAGAFALHMTGPTRDRDAWLHGLYRTIQILEPLKVARLHLGGGTFASPMNGVSLRSHEVGVWFAFGDQVLTAGDHHERSSLPHSGSRLALLTLPPGLVINLGIASERFLQRKGGAWQAEYRSGLSQLAFRQLFNMGTHGYLMDRYSHV